MSHGRQHRCLVDLIAPRQKGHLGQCLMRCEQVTLGSVDQQIQGLGFDAQPKPAQAAPNPGRQFGGTHRPDLNRDSGPFQRLIPLAASGRGIQHAAQHQEYDIGCGVGGIGLQVSGPDLTGLTAGNTQFDQATIPKQGTRSQFTRQGRPVESGLGEHHSTLIESGLARSGTNRIGRFFHQQGLIAAHQINRRHSLLQSG